MYRSKCPHLPVKATRAKPNWWKRITIGTVLLASAALAGPLFLAGAGVVGAALGAGGSFIVLAGVQATVGSAAARVVLGSKTSWSTVKKGHEYEDVLMADQHENANEEGKEEETKKEEAAKKRSPLNFWSKKKKPDERVAYVGSFRWCYFHGPGALYHENDLELMRGEFRLGVPHGKAVIFNPLHLVEKRQEEGGSVEEGVQELEKLVEKANSNVAAKEKEKDKGKEAEAKEEDPTKLSQAVSSGATCGWSTVDCERGKVTRILETDMERAPATIRLWLGSRVAQLAMAIRQTVNFDGVPANANAPQPQSLESQGSTLPGEKEAAKAPAAAAAAVSKTSSKVPGVTEDSPDRKMEEDVKV